MSILDDILAATRATLDARRRGTPLRALEDAPGFARVPLGGAEALRRTDDLGQPEVVFLAESKRRSPSKGLLRDPYDAAENVRQYAEAGAAAASVLTEPDFFGGAPEDLQAAREAAPSLPLLRKDFVVDVYQLAEARAWGADLVLLIATALDKHALHDLLDAAKGYGLTPLVEVHDVRELDRFEVDRAPVVGVNHRDLRTFELDLAKSPEVFRVLPPKTVRVAESGLKDAETIAALARAGADAVLIGETFMREPSPGEALRRLRADVAALLRVPA